MRSRNEIQNSELGRSGNTVYGTPKEELILEVLLDIRELLENPLIEVTRQECYGYCHQAKPGEAFGCSCPCCPK